MAWRSGTGTASPQAVRGEHIRFVPIETLIELKLASGMSAPHRLKDLADVLELIRISKLPPDFGDRFEVGVAVGAAGLQRAQRGVL